MHHHKFERFMIQLKKILSQLCFLKLWLTCTGQDKCWNYQRKLQFSHQMMSVVGAHWSTAAWGRIHEAAFYEEEFNFGTNILFGLGVWFVVVLGVLVCLFVLRYCKTQFFPDHSGRQKHGWNKSITIPCFPIFILIMFPIPSWRDTNSFKISWSSKFCSEVTWR